MSAKTLEQEEHERIVEMAKEGYRSEDSLPATLEAAASYVVGFVAGHRIAATARDKEMRKLRLLAEEQLTTLRKLKAEMLSDTRDNEIDELRARVNELEEALAKASKLFPLPEPK